MNKFLLTISILMTAGIMSYGQVTDDLRSQCALGAGSNARFLKDFRIELGQSAEKTGLRYKASISLWKNTKYRFSLCNAEGSKGKLILTIKDNGDNLVLSSFDKNGRTYPFVDFVCNRSGIYELYFDFLDGQQGSGVGVVSMLK